jgi:hypothetical protein
MGPILNNMGPILDNMGPILDNMGPILDNIWNLILYQTLKRHVNIRKEIINCTKLWSCQSRHY